MLLTPSDSLHPSVSATLQAQRDIIGGMKDVEPSVRDAVKQVLR